MSFDDKCLTSQLRSDKIISSASEDEDNEVVASLLRSGSDNSDEQLFDINDNATSPTKVIANSSSKQSRPRSNSRVVGRASSNPLDASSIIKYTNNRQKRDNSLRATSTPIANRPVSRTNSTPQANNSNNDVSPSDAEQCEAGDASNCYKTKSRSNENFTNLMEEVDTVIPTDILSEEQEAKNAALHRSKKRRTSFKADRLEKKRLKQNKDRKDNNNSTDGERESKTKDKKDRKQKKYKRKHSKNKADLQQDINKLPPILLENNSSDDQLKRQVQRAKSCGNKAEIDATKNKTRQSSIDKNNNNNSLNQTKSQSDNDESDKIELTNIEKEEEKEANLSLRQLAIVNSSSNNNNNGNSTFQVPAAMITPRVRSNSFISLSNDNFIKNETGKQEVVKGTVEQLLLHCISFPINIEFIQVFVFTHSLFLAPLKLIKALYLITITVLTKWIEANAYLVNASKAIHTKLLQFCEQLQKLKGNEEKWGIRVQQVMREEVKKFNNISKAIPLAPSLLNLTAAEQSILFLGMSPKAIAKQMCIVEHRNFAKVPISVLLRKANSRAIQAQIDNFNNMTLWVPTIILNEYTAKQRGQIIAKFIEIASYCHKYNNFASLFHVMLGLSALPIERMKKSWAFVNEKAMTVFEKLQKIVSVLGNYSEYRAALSAAQPPVVPFQAVVRKDLLQMLEMETYTEDKTINFYKNWIIGRYLLTIKRQQRIEYQFELDEKVAALLNFTPEETIDDLMDLSYSFEPLKKKKQKKVKATKSESTSTNSSGSSLDEMIESTTKPTEDSNSNTLKSILFTLAQDQETEDDEEEEDEDEDFEDYNSATGAKSYSKIINQNLHSLKTISRNSPRMKRKSKEKDYKKFAESKKRKVSADSPAINTHTQTSAHMGSSDSENNNNNTNSNSTNTSNNINNYNNSNNNNTSHSNTIFHNSPLVANRKVKKSKSSFKADEYSSLVDYQTLFTEEQTKRYQLEHEIKILNERISALKQLSDCQDSTATSTLEAQIALLEVKLHLNQSETETAMKQLKLQIARLKHQNKKLRAQSQRNSNNFSAPKKRSFGVIFSPRHRSNYNNTSPSTPDTNRVALTHKRGVTRTKSQPQNRVFSLTNTITLATQLSPRDGSYGSINVVEQMNKIKQNSRRRNATPVADSAPAEKRMFCVSKSTGKLADRLMQTTESGNTMENADADVHTQRKLRRRSKKSTSSDALLASTITSEQGTAGGSINIIASDSEAEGDDVRKQSITFGATTTPKKQQQAKNATENTLSAPKSNLRSKRLASITSSLSTEEIITLFTSDNPLEAGDGTTTTKPAISPTKLNSDDSKTNDSYSSETESDTSVNTEEFINETKYPTALASDSTNYSSGKESSDDTITSIDEFVNDSSYLSSQRSTIPNDAIAQKDNEIEYLKEKVEELVLRVIKSDHGKKEVEQRLFAALQNTSNINYREFLPLQRSELTLARIKISNLKRERQAYKNKKEKYAMDKVIGECYEQLCERIFNLLDTPPNMIYSANTPQLSTSPSSFAGSNVISVGINNIGSNISRRRKSNCSITTDSPDVIGATISTPVTSSSSSSATSSPIAIISSYSTSALGNNDNYSK